MDANGPLQEVGHDGPAYDPGLNRNENSPRRLRTLHLSRYGSPRRSSGVSSPGKGATEVWSYSSGIGYQSTSVIANADGNFSATRAGNTINGSSSTFGTATGISTRRFCNVNVVMSAGLVSAVNYAGPTGGLLTAGESAHTRSKPACRRADPKHLKSGGVTAGGIVAPARRFSIWSVRARRSAVSNGKA